MFGFMNRGPKQNSVAGTNPFDSDDESDSQFATKPAKRAASEPMLNVPDLGVNPQVTGRRGGARPSSSSSRDKHKNDFRDSGDLENASMQELENYAVYKAEETTSTVNNCLRIAEDIKGDATRTLEMLHQQGEQITRTHQMVANTDKDLSKGEKLLNNLGGMFSMPWKPKKTREINGPVVTADNSSKRNEKDPKQREKLGLAPVPNGKAGSRTPPPEPMGALQKVELEKAKQDDALSDLSNILGDLKGMAVDMGSELERQDKALDHLSDDVDEMNSRMKGANQRARKLIGK